MKNIIYALTDPRTNEIRYIGKSTKGVARLKDHLKPKQLIKKNHKTNWINSLLKEGLTPNIMVIEYFDNKYILNEKEIHYIKYYKDLGYSLTNSTDGGEGTPGYKHKKETKDILSQKKKKYHENRMEPWVPVNKKQKLIMNDQEYKHCSDCNQFKLLLNFDNNKTTHDKLKGICKDCSKIRNEERPKSTLSEEQWKQSYIDRSAANSAGVLRAYENNPELKANISKARSKPIIGTHIETGEMLEFPSALNAKDNGYHNVRIGEAIKHNKPYKKYTWKFK